MTIHESQGLTFEAVYIVRTTSARSHVLTSVPHTVVAIFRHTKTCVCFTDCENDDATARLISNAEKATTHTNTEYNLQMAIKNGDERVRDALVAFLRQKSPLPDTQ